MIVSSLAVTTERGLATLQSTITWEEVNESPFNLFVEGPVELQRALWPDPNGLLIACVLPAWRAGERRIRVDGALCPCLCSNLRVALATLQSWYPSLGPVPVIEPTDGFKVAYPSQPQGLLLLSCGVDSLATLRWNTLNCPPNHPSAIRGALPILFDDTVSTSRSKFDSYFEEALSAARPVTEDVGVQVLPVRTNLWWLVDDGYFYDEKWHGAFLSAIACLFSNEFDLAYISSSYGPANLPPWGSHPMLDNYYTASHFRIEHHGLATSRLEKTTLVAKWPVGLNNLRVCQKGSSWKGNCGTCEKCIRTMTTLVAIGHLRDCTAFPRQDMSVDLLETLREYKMIKSEEQASWYTELIPALRQQGRSDLAKVIEECAVVDTRRADT